MTGPEGSGVQKGKPLRVRVERLAFGGRGVARVNGYTVFVEGGLPGQEVEALVFRRRRSYAEARVLRVLAPGPHDVPAPCPHFGVCGGCVLQHLDVAAQVAAKRDQVAEVLARVGGLPDLPVLPPLPSPEAFGYRNKMEFSFATRWLTEDEVAADTAAGPRFGLGLHVRGRFDRVVDVACHLHSPEGREILGLVRDLTTAGGLPAYSTRTHDGFWRHVMIREGAHTGERMVVLITAVVAPGSAEAREVERVAAALHARGPRITSLLHGMNDRKAALAVCDQVRVLSGEPVIAERLLDLTFEIGPNTFFQTNTLGAEVLFREALAQGAFRPEETVWDLYCGAGAIALCLARGVRRVVGVEVVPEAVEAARRNALANGITNAEFLVGDVKALLRDGALAGHAPDAVVLDPPRDGVHADVLAAVGAARPARILYVSCNPATLARDLALLVAAGYAPGPVRPVDLFPHTGHIECVVRLDRTGAP